MFVICSGVMILIEDKIVYKFVGIIKDNCQNI